MTYHNHLMKNTLMQSHLEQVLINSPLKFFIIQFLLGEMYMFNRNSQQSSMSEFIKGKIQEEDDDKDSKEKAPTLEDFMFQMDKGNTWNNNIL